MSDNQKVLERIRKLFNLAQNNANENEAKSALLTAQKLMAENGIEQSQVEDKISEKTVVHEQFTHESRVAWYKKVLASIISKNFRCTCYYNRNRNGGLVFLGLKEDVELAKMVFEFAKEAIEHGANYYIKKLKSNYYVNSTVGIKNDYMQGWLDGLSAQYKEQVDKNGWGLILVKDALVLKEVERLNLTKGQKSSHSVSKNDKARQTGYQHGKSFSGNTQRIVG